MHRLIWLLACLLLCSMASAQTAPAITDMTHADAAPADWSSQTPPSDGWVPVKLIDLWTAHWPHHDGVVWYRLHWHQASTDRPVGLLVDYVSIADVIYVNGSQIYRDTHLVEPLSRTWIKPQYFLLDKPLLREGDNILLVRVSGLSKYLPGLGVVAVGDPAAVQARYQRGVFWRYDLQLFDQIVTLVFCGLFFILWLMRRKDSSYGWYALSTLMSFGYGINFISGSIWPFPSTDGWEAFNAFAYLAAASSFTLFLLRYCDRRWPRLEWTLFAVNLVSSAFVFLTPAIAGENRGIWFAIGGTLYYTAIVVFTWYALRNKRTDHRVLATCLMIPLLVSIHDFLLFYGVISSNLYLMAITSPLTIIGMGFALAYRFAAAMKRVESFNIELKQEVDVATQRLGETLEREHALALNNTRIGERLNLVRDLHDGFGGSLLGAIAALENQHQPPDAARVVATLKELRDDLRLIIDTTTQEQDTDLAGLLVPLRHRWSQRLDAAGIDAHWQVEGLDQLHLGPAHSLDLLRLLQEALTNVLKHSGASRVDIALQHHDPKLRASIRDNGCGFDTNARGTGAGLASLRHRATRLGAQFFIEAAPGQGTALYLDLPLIPDSSTP
jgi:signal transduction histidine kinase